MSTTHGTEDSPPTVNATDSPFQWSKCSLGFWMIVVSNLTCDFLSAFDMTAISTALPTIVQDVGGEDSSFIWAGSAYSLAAIAIIPLCGGLVSIFRRKPILLLCVAFFAIGSVIASASQSLNMLIAARAIQGFGSGGCLAVSEIIYADLVPLPQRGIMQGITAVVWAFASAIGPIIGGALASSGLWRWLFFLNLPITAAAASLELFFLPNNPPQSTFLAKIGRIDWIGGGVIVGGSAALTLALTWGGLQFSWTSVQVLLSLIIGIVALLAFFFVERYLSPEPIVPWIVVRNRTCISGYLGTAVHGIVSFVAIYYLPVYFQAVKGASAVRSGVDILDMAMFITPASMACSISVQVLRCYRPQNYLGWALVIAGFGILSILDASSSKAQQICSQIVIGIGLGIVWISTQFPILAPLPFSNNAHALAFFTFVRTLAQTLGVAIGGSALQNSLRHHLPPSFIALLPSGASFAYSAIPTIHALDEPLRTEVQQAFASSLKLLWHFMIGLSGLGLLTVPLMKEVHMRADVDEQWGLDVDAKDNGRTTDEKSG